MMHDLKRSGGGNSSIALLSSPPLAALQNMTDMKEVGRAHRDAPTSNNNNNNNNNGPISATSVKIENIQGGQRHCQSPRNSPSPRSPAKSTSSTVASLPSTPFGINDILSRTPATASASATSTVNTSAAHSSTTSGQFGFLTAPRLSGAGLFLNSAAAAAAVALQGMHRCATGGGMTDLQGSRTCTGQLLRQACTPCHPATQEPYGNLKVRTRNKFLYRLIGGGTKRVETF